MLVEPNTDKLMWCLEWEFGENRRSTTPGPELLEGFLTLVDGSPAEIWDYAEKWGVLAICEHGLPNSHASTREWLMGPFVLPRYHAAYYSLCQPLEVTEVERSMLPVELWIMQYYEPLAAWRKYSRMAHTLLDLAVTLDDGKLGTETDWKIVCGDQWSLPHSVEEGRFIIGRVVSGWLALGGVAPYLDWTDQNPQLRLSVEGLFGALGTQVLLALSRSEGFAVCTECGRLYTPRPKARTGTRRYCEQCRSMGAPARDASAAYRRRKKGEDSGNGKAR